MADPIFDSQLMGDQYKGIDDMKVLDLLAERRNARLARLPALMPQPAEPITLKGIMGSIPSFLGLVPPQVRSPTLRDIMNYMMRAKDGTSKN